jgi:hypothetical protein
MIEDSLGATRHGASGYLVRVGWSLGSLCFCLAGLTMVAAVPERVPPNLDSKEISVRVLWRDPPAAGRVEVLHGALGAIELDPQRGRVDGDHYTFVPVEQASLTLRLRQVISSPGAGATIVTIGAGADAFSFFVRDVTADFPIILPRQAVAVTTDGDPRTYQQIADAMARRGTRTRLQQIESEPEAGFERVSSTARDQRAPTWLGVSRDVRLFKINHALDGNGLEQDVIRLTRGTTAISLPETKSKPTVYGYAEGRGQGPIVDVQRYLEEGALPILHKVLRDDDVHYHTTSFVTLETSALTAATLKGTHFLVADSDHAGNTLTEEQKQLATKIRGETNEEELVLYLKIEAKNEASVPRYAWFKAPRPGWTWTERYAYTFDPASGFAQFSPDRVFCVSQFNGQPMPQEEMAVLLQPGQTATFDCRIPHQPISSQRASALARQDYARRYAETQDFWRSKRDAAARIHVPEKRVNEMIQAGLLHLDLVTYGLEPEGVLAPSIGVYSPIGTESAPIVMFYASMGLHDRARRSLMYFLEKQRPDGLIQNFSDYMIETGAALWAMGEYNRYSNDTKWVAEVKPKLLRSTDYLVKWRNRNKTEALRGGGGYGLIDGKVADPNDPYHQFMLNAYAYLGLSRVAEMLRTVDPSKSEELAQEAESWKTDIREALAYAMAHSPAIPLGDGTWSRTAPPWTETIGPRGLYATGAKQFTHGTFSAADSLLGPLHLIFGEVLAPSEPMAVELLDTQAELNFRGNIAFSQPYYSRHDWIQLKRGMVKPFLQTWYTGFAALADRETYTFWEHLHHVSEHKVHEEAWFLMQTRWMLYLEDGEKLRVLPGVPRSWLEAGKKITVDGASTYFGPLSFSVSSQLDEGRIEAMITCGDDRRPSEVLLRLPHPEGLKPKSVHGGTYDPAIESVRISPFTGQSTVRLEF